jgi:uncharacterized protein
MSPEEKTVIGGIFERLKGAADAPRDAEADKFIADQIKVQPYAPYVMAQSIYAQEQALTGMQQKVEQLQAQVQQLEQYAQQMQQQQAQASSGFLGGLFGGGAKPVAPPPQMNRAPFQQNQPQAAPAGGPWGQQPQQGQAPGQQPGPWGQQAQPQQKAGMGFLGTAAMTAAGVAGGMLAANALTNMFSGGAGGAAHAATPGSSASSSPAAPASDQSASAGEPSYGNNSHDASYEDEGDFGGGGGDDWA